MQVIIKDTLYGQFKVEPVLQKLIESRPVQRLKFIHQGGAGYLVNPLWNTTRYEHSVGVMLLIRKLGGTLDEQIAGLLHDVSHTAFSHVIDWVLDYEEEDFHEQVYTNVIESSEIPEILKEHGFSLDSTIYDFSKWTLLEKEAPDLCADRIDYTLRDLYAFGQLSKTEIDNFLPTLCVQDGVICISNEQAAEWFVKTYYKEVIDFFLHPLNVYSNDLLARILKEALSLSILKKDDFFLTDEEVMSKLRESPNPNLKQLLDGLNADIFVQEDNNNFTIHRIGKLRLIDPYIVLKDGWKGRVSERSDKVKYLSEEAMRKSVKGVYVRVES